MVRREYLPARVQLLLSKIPAIFSYPCLRFYNLILVILGVQYTHCTPTLPAKGSISVVIWLLFIVRISSFVESDTSDLAVLKL